jgi:hypothetical protein
MFRFHVFIENKKIMLADRFCQLDLVLFLCEKIFKTCF